MQREWTEEPPIEACPFCGGRSDVNSETNRTNEGERVLQGWVQCTACEARGPMIRVPTTNSFFYVECEAIAKWNERTVPNNGTTA